jgi:hypothetical protein
MELLGRRQGPTEGKRECCFIENNMARDDDMMGGKI